MREITKDPQILIGCAEEAVQKSKNDFNLFVENMQKELVLWSEKCDNCRNLSPEQKGLLQYNLSTIVGRFSSMLQEQIKEKNKRDNSDNSSFL